MTGDYQKHRELVEAVEALYNEHGYRFAKISATPVGRDIVWQVWTHKPGDIEKA